MSQTDLEAWWEGISQASAAVLECTAQTVKDDTCGWGAAVQEIWDQSEKLWPGGLLLTGPAGCGRHNTAFRTVSFLETELGYSTLYLDGAGLWDEAASFAQVKARFNHILDRHFDTGSNLCILLDRWEDCPWLRQLTALLAQVLCEYRVRSAPGIDPDERYPKLFLILVADDEQNVPPLLRKNLQLCKMSLPIPTRRNAFLALHAEDMLDYIPLDKLTEHTDGYTYAQLENLANNARLLIMIGQNTGRESQLPKLLAELVGSQGPAPDTEQRKRRLMDKAEEFLDKLPEYMEKAAAARGTAAPNVSMAMANAIPNTPPEPAQVEQFSRQKLETMRVRQLTSVALDKDIAESLLNAR